MSSKARLCAGCGKWAEEGQWVAEDDGTYWWVCNVNPLCSEDTTVVYPQPDSPSVDY